MRYRKRPVIVEAFRWTGGPDQQEDPPWIVEALQNHTVFFQDAGTSDVKLCIKTLEGAMTASVGDYIIRGVQGEIYPCKPDIFAKTYDPMP